MKKNLALVMAAASVGLFATTTAKAQDAIVVEEETVSITDATNCKTQYFVNSHDNWFIQLGAGIDVPLVENRLVDGKAKRHITATYNLGFGKWFSPYIGFRLSGYYGAMHWDNESYSKANYANLNLDFMWDMCNSLGGVDADRPVSVIPFVGLGGTYVWDINSDGTNIYRHTGDLKTNSWTLPVSAGIQFRFRLCRYVDFFLEGRASFYGDNFNGAAYDEPLDVNIQATGGFSFNIGGVNYRAYNACRDLAYINSLNNQVNALRGELAATGAALAAAQAQLPCPEVVAVECPENNAAPMMSTVRFKINSSEITDEEMVNVYNTAEYLKANPSVNVLIKGYADKNTGTSEYNKVLSQKRAQAVYDSLTKTYGIDKSRLAIEAEGSSQQIYDVNNWNRIVIFVPGN
ncbi:MAG: OmpA family protein [Muribaculaceae bacterium]|nr:OmpA family protein [Muribaculaceae bacterium]